MGGNTSKTSNVFEETNNIAVDTLIKSLTKCINS